LDHGGDEGMTAEWLLRLATLSVGAQIDENGNLAAIRVGSDEWEKLRKEIVALPRGSAQTEWAQWLVAAADRRTVAPGFSIGFKEAEARGLLAPMAAKIVAPAVREEGVGGEP
jgi:hypothetical protein